MYGIHEAWERSSSRGSGSPPGRGRRAARGDPRDGRRREATAALLTLAQRHRREARAWQLERVREGVYRSTEPVPTGGTWKTLVRVHRDASMLSVPVFLSDDPAIPAKGCRWSARPRER
jgi:hypothetical protein